jgi:hypothetical protein
MFRGGPASVNLTPPFQVTVGHYLTSQWAYYPRVFPFTTEHRYEPQAADP